MVYKKGVQLLICFKSILIVSTSLKFGQVNWLTNPYLLLRIQTMEVIMNRVYKIEYCAS